MEQVEYEEPYPISIKRRVDALKNLQQKHRDIERKFHEELLAIERKYIELYSPLYQKRHSIVTGAYEPTDEECKQDLPPSSREEPKPESAGTTDIRSDVRGSGQADATDAASGHTEDVEGIPGFWLQCLKNHPGFRMIITEADERALGYLENITLSYLKDQYGFKFEFCFRENLYFTNSVLTKTYYLSLPSGSTQEDYSFDKSEGCAIDWKEDKNLAVRVETKKQRHKGTNRTRIIKRQVPQETFFTFFAPPSMPSQTDTVPLEEIQELRDSLDTDFDLGEDLRTKIVPNAVWWFTGDAATEFLVDDDIDDDGDYFDEESEEEGDEGTD